MDASFASKPPRRGFTLVEMLAVIMIIGILVALLLPAIQAARNRAKIASISLEISQLDMALKRYKEEFGDYPPDFFGVDLDVNDPAGQRARGDVLRHLRKAFPRYVPGVSDPTGNGYEGQTEWNKVCADVSVGTDGTMDLNNMTPASAIVFWLGGLPETGGSTKLMGFSANSRNPFDPGAGPNARGSRLPALFDFSEPRIRLNGPADWPTYCPAGMTNPYVYFKARMAPLTGQYEYGFVDNSGNNFEPFCWPPGQAGSNNVCRPYLDESLGDPTVPATVRRWMAPKKFQIISAGLNDEFGNEDRGALPCRYAKTGEGFGGEGGDHDNITNFSGGKLEDEM